MQNNLDHLIDQIISHPLFQRLKDIEENSEGWHDHEKTFDHLTKTAKIAKEQVQGEFVSNQKAKDLFKQWINEKIYGMKRLDVAVITALIHDCGKILAYRENGEVSSLRVATPNFSDQVMFPGHEYWGGKIVAPRILNDAGFDPKLINLISLVIKQHDSVGAAYFKGKEEWSIDQVIKDIKSRAEGVYKESLFNIYCDGYTAPAFASGKVITEKIFNSPSFYIPREYFIP